MRKFRAVQSQYPRLAALIDWGYVEAFCRECGQEAAAAKFAPPDGAGPDVVARAIESLRAALKAEGIALPDPPFGSGDGGSVQGDDPTSNRGQADATERIETMISRLEREVKRLEGRGKPESAYGRPADYKRATAARRRAISWRRLKLDALRRRDQS